MKVALVTFILVIIVLTLVGLEMNRKSLEVKDNFYPDPKDLPIKDGKIIHPVYGEYPVEIPFEQGMTLMPGQGSTFAIVIELNKED